METAEFRRVWVVGGGGGGGGGVYVRAGANLTKPV